MKAVVVHSVSVVVVGVHTAFVVAVVVQIVSVVDVVWEVVVFGSAAGVIHCSCHCKNRLPLKQHAFVVVVDGVVVVVNVVEALVLMVEMELT